ncbi:hypothetical protein FACS1894191_7480 [Clostridia bacterium]|nr:hypothetical protein FACS1894191_7480 [Clostridia bacterium]
MPDVRELLLRLEGEQAQNRKLFGRSYQKSDYIFVHPDGSQRRPDVVTRGFQRVLIAHGLKVMRFHDLRHSCASILHDKDHLSDEDIAGLCGERQSSTLPRHFSINRKS